MPINSWKTIGIATQGEKTWQVRRKPKWKAKYIIRLEKWLHRPTSRIGNFQPNTPAKTCRASGRSKPNELEWFQKWDKVLDDSNKPFFKWFTGAKVNIVHNCIDRHLKTWRKNKLALIWESEDGKDQRTFSYYALNREVNRFANIIKAMGIKKGDRVTIYLPRIPEIVFAMLACAKIGAIHSVVFGGFSTDALQGRIDDSESKLLITAMAAGSMEKFSNSNAPWMKP